MQIIKSWRIPSNSFNNNKFNEMKKNMGVTDRITRIVIAAIIAALYFTNTITGTFGIVLLILGIIFLFTAIFRFCPLYFLFGLKTNEVKNKE